MPPKHRHIFRVFYKDPDIKSRASYGLLVRYLYTKDVDNHIQWLRFRGRFVKSVKRARKNKKLTCCYCGRDLVIRAKGNNIPDTATIDHIEPLSKGGSRYDQSNLAISCSKCNSLKGNMNILEFVAKYHDLYFGEKVS